MVYHVRITKRDCVLETPPEQVWFLYPFEITPTTDSAESVLPRGMGELAIIETPE